MKLMLVPVLAAIAGLTAAPETLTEVQDKIVSIFNTTRIEPLKKALDDPYSIGQTTFKDTKTSEAEVKVENGRLKMSKLDMGRGLDMGKRQ